MENIIKFLQTYNVPALVINQLRYSIGSPEHPIYHPEGTLEKHIDIVLSRTWDQSIEMQFAGLLHDITKAGYCPPLWEGKSGRMKCTENGDYWQNIHHHSQAGRFMQLPEIKTWVESYCDFDTVYTIVVNHMKMKNFLSGEKGLKYGMKETKRQAFREKYNDELWNQMYYFSTVCDNMLLKV